MVAREADEMLVVRHRIPAAQAWARANAVDRAVVDGERRTLGIVTSGKAWMAVRQALAPLRARSSERRAARTDDATVPSIGELEALPRSACVAFAGRCALRLQAGFLSWAEAPPLHFGALHRAVQLGLIRHRSSSLGLQCLCRGFDDPGEFSVGEEEKAVYSFENSRFVIFSEGEHRSIQPVTGQALESFAVEFVITMRDYSPDGHGFMMIDNIHPGAAAYPVTLQRRGQAPPATGARADLA